MPITQSSFRSPADRDRLQDWCRRVLQRGTVPFQPREVSTRFGRTHVWEARRGSGRAAVMILPGFRTCSLIWNLDDTLRPIADEFDVYLVDVIGQPSLSDPTAPDIRGPGYGQWLAEVVEGLGLDRVFLVGASFGGMLQFKLAAVAPHRIRGGIMINPVGLRGVSMGLPIMVDNLLPMIRPNPRTVDRFLDRVVFAGGETVSAEARVLLAEYILLALTRHRYRGSFPYRMRDDEIRPWTAPLHLVLGAGDRLIPHGPTEARARELLPSLKSVHWLPGHGHGAEVTPSAAAQVLQILRAETATRSAA